MDIRRNNQLRRALDGITDHLLPHEHASVIEGLKSLYPHSISVLDEPPGLSHGYNCYMYALGMQSLPEDLVELGLHANTTPNGAFVAYLIATGMLEPDENGELAIYFEPPMPKHAGLRNGHNIISKWGIGRLWSHRPDEVPLSYGLRLQFFKRLADGRTESLYRDYVHRLLGS